MIYFLKASDVCICKNKDFHVNGTRSLTIISSFTNLLIELNLFY
jgi:hypothetical protein